MNDIRNSQNYLHSQRLVSSLIANSDITTDDLLVEIGPGKGIITDALLERGCKVIAIEMDLDYNNLTEEEYFQKYNYDYEGNIRSALYDLQDFNFCKVKEIEINKRLVDIMELYKV